MMHGPMRFALIVALAGGLGVALRTAVTPLGSARVRPAQAAPARSAAPGPRGDPDSLDHDLVVRDPFRVARRPAVPYDPISLAQPPAHVAPRPALAVAGILWDGGADPTALVEGLPGTEGARVVRPGDVVGGLRIKAIERLRVVVTGMDTVWTLGVKEPWR